MPKTKKEKETAMSKKTERSAESCRLGKVGGQAVIEGVMMKNGNDWSLAVRKENGKIEVTSGEFTSVRKKNKLLDLQPTNHLQMGRIFPYELHISRNFQGKNLL